MEPKERAQHPQLKVVSGPLSGQSWDLGPYSHICIGRGAEPASGQPGALQIVIDDRRLSRSHVEIVSIPGGWRVRDLGSSNGTFVDGERVKEVNLRPGQLIQLGATVLELVLPGSEMPRGDEAHPGPALQQRSRRPRRMAMGIALAAALLAVVAALLLLRSQPNDLEATAAIEKKTAAPSLKPREAGRGSAGVVPAPRVEPESGTPPPSGDNDAATLVAASLEAGDYRRALSQLDGVAGNCSPGVIESLRAKVSRAASAELEEEARNAMRLAEAGDFDAARSRLEELLLRLPEDLASGVVEPLERVRALALAEGASNPPRKDPAASAREAEFEKRFLLLATSFQQLTGSPGSTTSAWGALLLEIGKFVEEWRGFPSYPRHRPRLQQMHATAFARSPTPESVRSLLSAASVEWSDGSLRLRYDFSSDDQLRDFVLVSRAGGEIARKPGGLALRGECRLLHGNPFTRRIVVRGKVPQGGFDAGAPNLNLALFTDGSTRLTDDSRAAPSLLNAFQVNSGPEPADFAAFLWGYRAVVAEYGGSNIEEITPVGSPRPVKMPLHAILFGRSGQLLHQDRRECVWVAQAPRFEGPVAFEIALDPASFAWKVNGRPVAQVQPEAAARLKAISAHSGSVTLFARTSQILLRSLEVEGQLDPAWLEARLEKAAVRDLERLERK